MNNESKTIIALNYKFNIRFGMERNFRRRNRVFRCNQQQWRLDDIRMLRNVNESAAVRREERFLRLGG